MRLGCADSVCDVVELVVDCLWVNMIAAESLQLWKLRQLDLVSLETSVHILQSLVQIHVLKQHDPCRLARYQAQAVVADEDRLAVHSQAVLVEDRLVLLGGVVRCVQSRPLDGLFYDLPQLLADPPNHDE